MLKPSALTGGVGLRADRSRDEIAARSIKVAEDLKGIEDDLILQMKERFEDVFYSSGQEERSIFSQYDYRCLCRELARRGLLERGALGILNRRETDG